MVWGTGGKEVEVRLEGREGQDFPSEEDPKLPSLPSLIFHSHVLGCG